MNLIVLNKCLLNVLNKTITFALIRRVGSSLLFLPSFVPISITRPFLTCKYLQERIRKFKYLLNVTVYQILSQGFFALPSCRYYQEFFSDGFHVVTRGFRRFPVVIPGYPWLSLVIPGYTWLYLVIPGCLQFKYL